MEDLRSPTILVVDDDSGHRELVRRNLKRGGVSNNIVCLEDGRQVLDYVFRRGSYNGVSGHTPLLILLDINMPGVNGVDVLRQIKSDPTHKKIPIIMLTTTDDPREVSRCYDLGCNVYMTKPVEPDAFIESIKRLGMFISVVCAPRLYEE